MIAIIFWLLVSHFVIDFPLQGEAVAREKSPYSITELQKMVPWPWWMTSHALMHGGGVALATGSIGFGIVESVLHWLIDWGKVEKKYSFVTDQILHLLCKAFYVILLSFVLT
jgi:hypothetical protein